MSYPETGLVRRSSVILLLTMFPAIALQAAEIPANIGGSLRQLIRAASENPNLSLNAAHLALNSATNRYQLLPGRSNMFADVQNRVLMRIVLNGGVPVDQVAAAVQRNGGQVVARSSFGRGLMSAYLPLASASAVAQEAGVQSIHLTFRPVHNVGLVTAQSVEALDVSRVLASGITGKGVTLGIISDSYNTLCPANSTGCDDAATDVASGDLPNTTSPSGVPGLKALIEDFPNGTDEGRAMAQIVHDMAPGAALCFATADNGEVDFANNILKLASDTGACNADVIVDDVLYFDEPFFSDGILADAVNRVSTIPKSDGSRVSYFSAAGNQQFQGYDAFFRPIPAKLAAQQGNTPVDLTTIPSSIDISGGLHNFGGPDKVVVAQPLTIQGNPILVLQWNDPFYLGKITTSYSLLLFDANGKFIQASDTASNASSADNAFVTDEPIQAIAFDTTATNGSAQYFLVIARSGQGTHEATHLKWVDFEGSIYAPQKTDRTPVLIGHPGARNDISVAAYNVDPPPFIAAPPFQPELEYFSSPGGFFNYFDAQGNRLVEPEFRQKPEIACTDGLFTTFFGQQILPSDAPYYRFFGTSAAAPCAASVAGLMLDKALSGRTPRHLAPEEIVDGLRQSVPTHDQNSFFIAGQEELGNGGRLILIVRGNDNQIQNPSNFRVSLSGVPGWTLNSLQLTIPSANELQFFQTSNYLAQIGRTSPGVTVQVTNLPAPSISATLNLSFGGFGSGGVAEFDVDRADPINGYLDDDSDRLNNTGFQASLTDAKGQKVTVSGVLNNWYGPQWNTFDGRGLLNADLAVAQVR